MASIQKYQTQKGTRWRALVYAGVDPATDKPVVKQKRGFATKREAQHWADKTTADILRGAPLTHRAQAPNFSDFAALWYDQYKLSVKPSTARKTAEILRLHVIPVFGDTRIDAITPAMCQQAVNAWTIHSHGRTMAAYSRRIMKAAVRDGLIQADPWDRVDIPKPPDKLQPQEPPFWTRDELTAFLEACQADKRPDVYPFFRLLAYTGMRRGEILALEWSAVDLDARTVTIRQAMTTDADGQITIGTPKSRTSCRTLTLDAGTVEALRRWQGLAMSSRFVFEGSTGKPLTASRPAKVLRQICQQAGIRPIKIHGLRHTHCSLLFAAGATPKEVQDRLGHASAQITLDIYTHLTSQQQAQTADRFAKYLDSY